MDPDYNMSIFTDNPETIFRMINWLSVILDEWSDYKIIIPHHVAQLQINEEEGAEFSYDGPNGCYRIDIDLINRVYISCPTMKLYFESDGVVYRFNVTDIRNKTSNIPYEEFIALVPQELDDICEYVMGCGLMTIQMR